MGGALVTVGVVGVVLGGAADRLLGQEVRKTASLPDDQTSTTTSTMTEVQTLTNTQTETVVNTQTATETLTDTLTSTATVTKIHTETQTLTDIQTETQTLMNTQTATVTDSTTSSSSSVASTADQIRQTTEPFSIFWITDTQFLSESNPGLFGNLTNWIVSNWGLYNGKMVVHTGDIVQTGNQLGEWENASQAMSVLLQNGIPYTWCAGNHDDLTGGDSTSGWNGSASTSAFNPSLVSGQVDALQYSSWVGDYHDGMNTAASFSVNGLNFLVINIEWNAQSDVLEWVGLILDDPVYANYYVVIAPHAYVDAAGVVVLLSNGIDLTSFAAGLTRLMDEHSSNVFLTLNGHYATDSGYNTSAPINNRNQLMFDRQDCTDDPGDPTGQGVDAATSATPNSEKVGGATVTILTFDSSSNQISVSTYDVFAGKWRDDQWDDYSITMFPASLLRNRSRLNRLRNMSSNLP